MSVLLNITMPKTCEVCPCNDDNWTCGATKEYFDDYAMRERRSADCPLIEVPTPHGRLGDLDELIEKYGEWYTEEGTESGYIGTMKNLLDGASTVIEAEE